MYTGSLSLAPAGHVACRADSVRNSEGHLLSAPPQLLNPLRLKDRIGRTGGSLAGASVEARWDALLDQTASDMSLYMGCIQDTVIITVPKAIVHCMVRAGGQAGSLESRAQSLPVGDAAQSEDSMRADGLDALAPAAANLKRASTDPQVGEEPAGAAVHGDPPPDAHSAGEPAQGGRAHH